MAKPARDPKTGKFKKKGSTRKRNPSRRKSTSSSSGGSRRRRRRRNPSGGGGGSTAITIASGTQDLGPVILSRLLMAWAIRTFGSTWGMSAVTGAAIGPSPYAGAAWPLKNYAGALAIGFAFAKMLGKTRGGKFARIFWQTTVRDVVTRFLWTEGIQRIPGGPGYLGAVVPPGMLWRDGSGNTFELDQWRRWQAMQGVPVQARALDGTLETARPLDGLATARSIDRANGGYGPRVRMMSGPRRGRLRRAVRQGIKYGRRHGRAARRLIRGARSMFGHYMPVEVDEAAALRGSYTGSGYSDPYNAVYGAR